MLAIIRDLYKRFLLAGRVYPQGLDHVREKAKAGKIVNLNCKEVSYENLFLHFRSLLTQLW